MADRLVTLAEVKEMIGLGRGDRFVPEQLGLTPERIDGKVYYRESDVRKALGGMMRGPNRKR